MIRVVFDTNTVISAFLFDGNESKLLKTVEKGLLNLHTSRELLDELERVLAYSRVQKLIKKADLSEEKVLEKVSELSIVISTKSKIRVIKEDPEDNRVLECAVDAKAHCIVSGDGHLLELREYRGIKILKTKELLSILKK